MTYEERTRIVFDFLYNMADGLLRGYEQPTHFSADRARDEINSLVDDINGLISSEVDEVLFKAIICEVRPAVRKRHGARGWPTSKIMQAATEDAIANAQTSGSDLDTEARMIAGLKSFFENTGKQMPGCGSAARTAKLIEDGVLRDLRDAMFRGFNLSPEQRKQASEQDAHPNETENHFRVMARIWDCSVDEAKERYAFDAMTPEDQQAALDAVGAAQEI